MHQGRRDHHHPFLSICASKTAEYISKGSYESVVLVISTSQALKEEFLTYEFNSREVTNFLHQTILQWQTLSNELLMTTPICIYSFIFTMMTCAAPINI